MRIRLPGVEYLFFRGARSGTHETEKIVGKNGVILGLLKMANLLENRIKMVKNRFSSEIFIMEIQTFSQIYQILIDFSTNTS